MIASRSMSRFRPLVSSRMMSTRSNPAVEKLRDVLDEYRRVHFTQEVPSRFKKEIVRAAAPQGQSDVCLNGMKRVLTNIGAQDRLTAEEIQSIFAEHANETGNIPGEKLIRQVL